MMKNKSLFTHLSRASLPILLVSSTALAQDSENSATVVFGDKEPEKGNNIAAFKTDTPLIDVPQSVSVTTAEQLQAQGIDSIGDLIDYTPGVNTSQGEGHRDSVVFRGVRSTADFFADGVRDDVQYYRSLYNVEQVEILRGPNALFFGRGGTGGVLNRVMKKAQFDGNFNKYKASIDSFGATSLEFDSNYQLNDNLAFRLNLHYDHLKNHRDFYKGDRFGLNPTFAYKLGEDTMLHFSYERADHERFIDRGIPTETNGRPVESLKDKVFADSELNTSTLDAHTFNLKLEHDFSDTLKANVTAFYGDYEKFYGNFYASGYDQANTPDQVTLDGYEDLTVRENLVLSSNLVGSFATGNIEHKFVMGSEFSQTSSDQYRYNPVWDTTGNDKETFNINNLRVSNGRGINANGVDASSNFNTDLNDDTRVEIDTYSFYVQDEIAVHRMLDVVLGARFDSFDIEVFNATNGETRSRKDEEISPRVGLVFKPVENLSIYGSYSKSFQPRSGEQYANINGDNNRLDPNSFTNLEAGVKWDIKPNLSLTLSAFEIERSSPEVSDLDPASFVDVDSEITGFEAQLKGNITDNWFISAGYSYLDGGQVNQSGNTGLRPRELPENTFSVWNNFQVNDKLGLGLGVVYQDDSFINNSNSAELPSYVRVDASASYKVSESLRLQLNVENLTDTTYFPNAHSTHQATVGAPINARFSIIGEF